MILPLIRSTTVDADLVCAHAGGEEVGDAVRGGGQLVPRNRWGLPSPAIEAQRRRGVPRARSE
jgi:hypothetical protein